VFLDTVARVVRNNPEAFFIVVGGTLFGLEKAYPLELHQQIERLDIGHAVRLVGFQPEVYRFYLAADIVVHSSIEPEPFGMVLLEAMACAKPVVASDCGGPREIVESGVTGLLVPPKDPEILAKAILTLLRDADRRIQMGQAGAKRVRDRFSAERMVGRLEALYEEMLAMHSAA
jgi:glycosyltransferase involved in cell wall biosynthesis